MSKRSREPEENSVQKRPRIVISDAERPIGQALDLPDEMWFIIMGFIFCEPPSSHHTRCYIKWTCRQWRRCVYTLTTQVRVVNIVRPFGDRAIQEIALYTHIRKLIIETKVDNMGRLLRGMDRQVADRLLTLRLNYPTNFLCNGFQIIWPKDGRFQQLTTLNAPDCILRVEDMAFLPPTLTKLRYLPVAGIQDLEHLVHLRTLDLICGGHHRYATQTCIQTNRPLEQLFLTWYEDLKCCYLDCDYKINHTPLELIIRPRSPDSAFRTNVKHTGDASDWSRPDKSCLTQVKKLVLQRMAFKTILTNIIFYEQFKAIEILTEQSVDCDVPAFTLKEFKEILFPTLVQYIRS